MVQVTATGKVEAAATERWPSGKHGRGVRGTNEVSVGSAAVTDGDGSCAKSTEGSTPVRG